MAAKLWNFYQIKIRWYCFKPLKLMWILSYERNDYKIVLFGVNYIRFNFLRCRLNHAPPWNNMIAGNAVSKVPNWQIMCMCFWIRRLRNSVFYDSQMMFWNSCNATTMVHIATEGCWKPLAPKELAKCRKRHPTSSFWISFSSRAWICVRRASSFWSCSWPSFPSCPS